MFDYFSIRRQLINMEARIMSAISDYAERVQVAFDAIGTGIEGVAADIAALKAKIEELQNSPGAITPEDQAILDEMEELAGTLTERITALDAENPAPEAPPA